MCSFYCVSNAIPDLNLVTHCTAAPRSELVSGCGDCPLAGERRGTSVVKSVLDWLRPTTNCRKAVLFLGFAILLLLQVASDWLPKPPGPP